MVEIRQEKKSREQLLSGRVEKLSGELDQLEKRHQELYELLRKTVAALAGLLEKDLPRPVDKAVKKLRKVTGAAALSFDKTQRAVEDLRQALIQADADRKRSAAPADESPLAELEAHEAFVGAINVLAAMGSSDPATPLGAALAGLKATVTVPHPDPQEIIRAAARVKSVIWEQQIEPPETSLEESLAREGPDSTNAVGWGLAKSLLRGMRLGERSLDDSVERVLEAIDHFERQGVLDQPALSLSADLIDQFRGVLQTRHREAQRALMEILGEVLKTEWDLIQALSGANQDIKAQGQASCAQMEDCLGDLTGEIGRAQNLEDLKNYALSAVGSLRQEINGLLTRQSQVVDESEANLESMRQAVTVAYQRMQAAEEKSLRMAKQNLTDQLTGAWNRAALERLLDRVLYNPPQEPASLVLVALNDFSQLISSFGAAAADKALITISKQIKGCLGPNQHLFRSGNDEFAVLSRGGDQAAATALAKRVYQLMGSISFTYNQAQGIRLSVTPVALQARQGEQGRALWARAEAALRTARQRLAGLSRTA